MTARIPRNTALLTAIVLALLLAVGCTKPGDSNTDFSDLTPEQALQQAHDAVQSADSFKFALSHASGTTQLQGGLELQRASGEVRRPGDMNLTAEANFGRAFVRIDAVVIGADTWMTNPITGDWAKIPPDDSPFGFLDPIQVIANLIDGVDNPSFAEAPGTGGDIKVSGNMPSASFEPLVGTVANTNVNVTLVIDADTFYLTKATVRGVLQDGDNESAERVIDLSGYGENFDISPPKLG